MNINKNIVIPVALLFVLGLVIYSLLQSRRQTNQPQPPPRAEKRFVTTPISTPILLPSLTVTPAPKLTVVPTPSAVITATKGGQLPDTGVNLVIPLFSSFGIGLLGWYLVKKQ